MPYQSIEATLSPADVKAIKAAFDPVLQKMPHLSTLRPRKERKSIFKAGFHSISFVQNALDVA
uniref:Uncharacterized protein n=1 Tax=Candidatus Kentrum sp. LFY TaxID=2126342 RepID=A0A450WPG9_9GAMM|nr:MAG: hypothetical protein BECKLFY1418C_GA0070996_105016 [Candidatus Kentron sp. LFY]